MPKYETIGTVIREYHKKQFQNLKTISAKLWFNLCILHWQPSYKTNDFGLHHRLRCITERLL